MDKIFFIFLSLFLIFIASIWLALKIGLYVKETTNLKTRVINGFKKGFILTFAGVFLFAIVLVIKLGNGYGDLFEFILWGTLVSTLGGFLFALASAIPVDINNNESTYNLPIWMWMKAGHLVGAVVTGIIVLIYLVKYVFRL